MTLPFSIQQELDTAITKAPEDEWYKLACAARRIETLIHMGPLAAELYMSEKYKEMD